MSNKEFFVFLSILFGGHLFGNAQTYSRKEVIITPDSLATRKDSTKIINPWQQAKNEYLFSPYLSHYVATSFRDSDGNKTNFSENGKYSNYNPRLYIAAPLFSEHINIVASLPYFFNQVRTVEAA